MRDDLDEFFVGYLPTPPRTRRFALSAAAIALVVALGVAVLAVVGSGTTGVGVGPQAHTDGVIGLLTTHPYGVLWVPSDHGPEAVLLVRQGKFGVGRQLDAMDGMVVRVSGYSLEREGRRMIELDGTPTAAELAPAALASVRSRAAASQGTTTLVGEIVDEKCWLGRMRPGGARTHRACAQLCVAGGIPPVIVGTDAAGVSYAAIVVGSDGAPITDLVLPYLAEPVSVTGELVREGDLDYLRLAPGGLERL